MTYKGIARGRTIELEESLPYSEGQRLSVSVEPLPSAPEKGSPSAVLKVMRELPQLRPEDVDELEAIIERGKLPVQARGVFEGNGTSKTE
jgi:hypothetical protein